MKPCRTRALDDPANAALVNRDGSALFAAHYALATDKVRYVGEQLAVVIARTVAIAKDGAEQVAVGYEALASVTDTVAAAQPDAPKVWDEARSNVCLDGDSGDGAATEAAFARAAHIVRFETSINRVTGRDDGAARCPVVNRSRAQHYTLYAGRVGGRRLKDDLANVLHVPSDERACRDARYRRQLRHARDDLPGMLRRRMGSARIGRPVKWTCERQEAFLSDYQARDLAVEASSPSMHSGSFLAMRGFEHGNAGAHTDELLAAATGHRDHSSIYRMPCACFAPAPVLSNTGPPPLRSAGRPEVSM